MLKTSSSTRPSASTRHKGKEIAKPITPQSESVFSFCMKTFEPKQLRGTRNAKDFALLVKNKTEDTRQGINNDNQSRQLFGNQRTMTIAGLRETSRQSGSATDWDTVALKSNGYGHYAKECRKPEAALRLRVITRGIDDDVQTKLNKLHGKDSEVSPEESSSTGQPSETGYVPKS
ncbi:hypothetical protein Tco_0097487 [Tanacetum coccineum]